MTCNSKSHSLKNFQNKQPNLFNQYTVRILKTEKKMETAKEKAVREKERLMETERGRGEGEKGEICFKRDF